MPLKGLKGNLPRKGPVKSPPKDTSGEESFLKETYPLREGESMVNYCPVGGLSYRINFYKNFSIKDRFLPNYKIVRSLYIILKKGKEGYLVSREY